MRSLLLPPLALVLAIPAPAGAEGPIEGVGPTGPIRKVAGGFRFTEGPAYHDGALYFTDIPNERVHRLADGGEATVFIDRSRHANGLLFTPTGDLLVCEMDGALVRYDPKTLKRTVLAREHNGARFNAPNDLVIDSQGGVYFTDPRFRAPEPLPQRAQCVYYLPAGEPDAARPVVRVTADLPAPNGVLLSRDGKVLYVLPSDSPSMRAYDVLAPGRLGAGREFCVVKQSATQSGRGSDGAALDERGNLYLTTQLGVQVFSPRGEHLGVIGLPEVPANVAFGGGGGKTLFATARTSVYAVPMAVRGHRQNAAP